MKPIESIHELYSVLNDIEGLEAEVAAFLSLYGGKEYEHTNLIHMGALLKFKSDNADRILYEIYEEHKRNGRLETALEAMELRLRLSDLEDEIMRKSMH
ncbi:hypothetical protein [Mediterraneibacter agrestimuris]|uniref:hypothetical protein n=1 Tax=Mediterraneibacter agrestimuris TaxID=2941333 RepID=UPI002040E322|nr:hypothetical protein [Mediterraneibacter agrestimuris]